jgi:class 3 adenylate cyclase
MVMEPDVLQRSAVTTASGAQAAAVVDRVVADVAFDGELRHARLRVVATAGAAVLWPLVCLLADDRTALVPVEFVCLGGLAVSAVALAWLLRRRSTSVTVSMASVVLDVWIAAGIGGAVLVAPPADFTGLLHATGFPVLYVAVAASGLRYSRRVAVAAGITGAIALVGLHVLDRTWNPQRSLDGLVHVGIGLLLVGIAMGVALTGTRRARDVSLRVARQTLLAERARSTLGNYVSPEVAEHALQNDGVRLGGSRQSVAILFTDLRGFTSLSEAGDAESLVRDLNEYFEHMVRVIDDQGGVVDKYIGDSIMAVFGAPTPRADDAARAIRAAHGLQVALARLNDSRGRAGKAPIAHGVGVHFGEVVAGNVGTADRTQYTVIGDVVNVAARLESATKEHGVRVLISADAVAAAGVPSGLPALRNVGTITVKGRVGALQVATLVHDPAP